MQNALSSPANYNLADFLGFKAAKAVLKAQRFKGVSSSHIFYFLLADDPELGFIFSRLLLSEKDFKMALLEEMKMIKDVFLKGEGRGQNFSEDFQETILESMKSAAEKGHKTIGSLDLFCALTKTDAIFAKFCRELGVKPEDGQESADWLLKIKEHIEKRNKFWEYDNLARKGTLAKAWTSGYTLNLDKYSKDINDYIKGRDLEVVGHEMEIKTMERILAKNELNNVLIVGDEGTGRKSMIYELAQKSMLGQSLERNNYKRVVELDLSLLIAEINETEALESALDKVFSEAVWSGNVILVINDLQNYVGQEPRPGIVDISGVLAPYLRLPQCQIVAITSYEGLHKNIEKNPSLLSLFNKVEISPISIGETLVLLERNALAIEKKYKVFIPFKTLREITSLCDRYLASLPFPEKAIDLLNESAVFASASGIKIILPDHISKVMSEKTKIPIGGLDQKEKEILLNLENLLHQRIVDQAEGISEIATSLRRARSQVSIKNAPMGCFLFLGPTGVGKTETSKALAEFYFGSEKNMIRLDMSEFQEIKDISRLMGSQSGEIGLLTTPVADNPFSIVLLDEIEKAHPNILNLFLQVLDEGHLTDGMGKKVDFKNTIIIATSNAGYQIILEAIEKKEEWGNLKKKLLDFLFEKAIFRPEFINRFDAVVIFKPLSQKDLLSISDLMINKIKKSMKEKGIDFITSESLKQRIVELGYNPIFGAREMKRVIQDKIENPLATALIAGKIMRGSVVEMNNEFKLGIKNYEK
jgi:ATP-dependent Clp protease ATP-binding subunit ClpC